MTEDDPMLEGEATVGPGTTSEDVEEAPSHLWAARGLKAHVTHVQVGFSVRGELSSATELHHTNTGSG